MMSDSKLGSKASKAKKSKTKAPPVGHSLLAGFGEKLSGAGPRRDRMLLQKELEALGLEEPSLKKR